MAGSLAGMMQQLQGSIKENPIGGQLGTNLLGQVSQGAGGMLGGALNMEPMKFMNQQGKNLEGVQRMAGLDLTTIEGLSQAAKLASEAGDIKTALAMSERASALQKAKQAAKAATGMSVGSSTTVIRDSEGNLFKTVPVTDKVSGVTTTSYAPLRTGGPAEPVGQVTVVSGTTGQSGNEVQDNRVQLAQYQSALRMSEAELDAALKKGTISFEVYQKRLSERNQKWETKRDEMVMNIPNLKSQVNRIRDTIGLIEENDTGGLQNSIANIKDYFNLGDTASNAKINRVMSDYVLENLNKMGTNPTEGERAFLINASENIGRGTTANVELFLQTLERLERNVEASSYLLENPEATQDEYVKQYNALVGGDSEKKSNKVQFGDMP